MDAQAYSPVTASMPHRCCHFGIPPHPSSGPALIMRHAPDRRRASGRGLCPIRHRRSTVAPLGALGALGRGDDARELHTKDLDDTLELLACTVCVCTYVRLPSPPSGPPRHPHRLRWTKGTAASVAASGATRRGAAAARPRQGGYLVLSEV